MCCEQPVNRRSLVRAILAFLARSRACVDVPCVLKLTPSIFPVNVYGMLVLLTVICGEFLCAMGMMWNLFMFVCIFHLCSNVFMADIAVCVASFMMFLDLDGCDMICVMSSA